MNPSKSLPLLLVTAIAMAITPAKADQNLFEADGSGNIYEFSSDGTRSTFASGLSRPDSLAFDQNGNLFVLDGVAETIYKFTPNGTRSTFASGLNLNPGFQSSAIAFDSAGNLFLAHGGLFGNNGYIYQYSSDGSHTTFATGIADNVVCLAFNTKGNLFVSSGGGINGGEITEFSPDGTRSIFANSGFGVATGLAFDTDGNLFAAVYGQGSIYKFDSNGSASVSAYADWPWAMAFNSSNVLFVGESHAQDITEITTNGTRTTFAGAGLNPNALAFQPQPVPEPASYAFLVIGLGALIALRRNHSILPKT